VNTRSAAGPKRPAIVILTSGLVVIASIAALIAFGGRGVGAVAAPLPTDRPSPAPVLTPAPSMAPSEVPADGGTDAMPIRVDIANIGGDDVYVDIVDETGTLIGASSGPAGSGASVDTYALRVENVDTTTLRLTWVDYPIDNVLALYVFPNDGVLHLALIQPEPSGPTDSIVHDRVLLLEFSQPISADDVEATLQDGLDTPGWAGYRG
jgi:hypothetical protein